MPELERRLTALGATIAYPPTPDLVSKVRPRLVKREAPARSYRRPLALAFAVLVLALAVAFAVPPARTALLRFFHIRGATVERVEVLPAAEPQTARGLGRPLGRAAAESRLGFLLVLPQGAHPDQVYVLEGAVATIPLRWHGRKLLLSEFRNGNLLLLKKLVSGQTFVEPLQVGSGTGLWIRGGGHVLIWLDRTGSFREKPVRVSGNVLLWRHEALTLRLQGQLSKREALLIAKELR
jgi:hypothetical protein